MKANVFMDVLQHIETKNPFYKRISNLLKKSIKFDFGDIANSDIFDLNKESPMRSIKEVRQLPFDCCYFEHQNSMHHMTTGLVIEKTDNGAFGCLLLTDNKLTLPWVIFDWNLDETISWHIDPTIHDQSDANSDLLQSFEDMILNFYVFIEILNCRNIEIKTYSYPPKINKKRIKKGKLPLFEYKTLHVSQKSNQGKNNSNSSKAKSSPRLHLRRGHIRRLASGGKIWVQACLVGEKKAGLVHKDYRFG